MIVAGLLAAARAQEVVENAGNAICSAFEPIAGTAGFTNGLQAVRTNAQTYGAGAFARRRLRGDTFGAMDFRGVFGVARVPVLCTEGDDGNRLDPVYNQPLDVGATNLGFNAPFLHDAGPLHVSFRAFYASSATTSTMGARLFTTSLPIINLYPAFFAPVVGRSIAGRSLTTMAVDWIGGGTFKSDLLSVQAGYTGTRGLYLDVTQEKVSLFANTTFQGGFTLQDAAYLFGGLDQFDPLDIGLDPDAVGKFGMTSLIYRRLPLTEGVTGLGVSASAVFEELRTGSLYQEDIAQLLDVRAAWQFGEQSSIRELAAAVHTPGYYQREGLDDDDEGSAYLRLGMVNLPDQPLFGVEGGPRFTVSAEGAVVTDAGWHVAVAAHMNDPALLDLYPFGYNAFGLSLEMSYQGER